jgi:hypothetical protein
MSVIHHAETLAGLCLGQDGFDEVASLPAGPGLAEETRDSHNERPGTRLTNQIFSGELGGAIDVNRAGCVFFRVWFCFLAVKYIVCTDVDAESVEVCAGLRHVEGPQSVYPKGSFRFFLCFVHSHIGGTVDHGFGTVTPKGIPHAVLIRDFYVLMGERDDMVASLTAGPGDVRP